jgi:hypothetical protein
MRKTLLALSALAAVAITTSAANRSEASPLVNPTALSGAIDDLALVDNVHCRPGWRHHSPRSWRRADGCVRDRRGAVIVVPGRTRYVWRDGVRVRIGDRDRGARTAIRSGDRTTIRSRTDVRVREGGGRDAVRTGGDTRRGGAVTQGRGGGTQERGGTMMQDRGGGAQKGGGAMQKGGGGTQKGGAQKGGQGQNPQ